MRRAALLVVGVVAAGVCAASPSQAVPGDVVPAGTYGFLARVTAGGQACSGALIDPLWVATSSSCLPQTGTVGIVVGTGVAAVGTRIVRHPDRDLAVVRLSAPVTGVAPIPLATTALTSGETVRAGGYGRTGVDWVPDRPHVTSFTVSTLTGADALLTGAKDTCKGDAGGPAFREVNGTPQLVALHRTSWQHGCLAVQDPRQSSTETRVDDLGAWFEERFFDLTATALPRHAVDLTWAARGRTSFQVYASLSPTVPIGPSTLVGTVGTPSFTHTALAAKQTWYYRIVSGTTSGIASATTALPTRSDFDGDGDDDIAAVYDGGGARTRLPVWPGGPNGIGTPEFRWDSGAGQYDAAKARWVTGDFNGDGRADAAAFYNYAGGSTSLHVLYATATGFAPYAEKWVSGPENWPAQTAKLVAGDFTADGRTDIAAFYDVGNGQTRLYLWQGTATGFDAPVLKWDSGAGQFDQQRATFVTGDFTGDGRTDIGGIYEYPGDATSMWVFSATTTGFSAPVEKWASGPGGFTTSRARWIAGDFNGDGRADFGAFYNYPGGVTKLLVFYANATGFDPWVEKWDSGPGNLPAQSARLAAGDYNGDGRADIAAFYNTNGVTRTFLWFGATTGLTPPVQQWDGGPGNGEAQAALIL